MNKSRLFGALCAFLLCAGVAIESASAASITLSSSDNGWYKSNGTDNPSGSGNIFIGVDNNNNEYRNFLQFDLSSASGLTITDATLTFLADNGGSWTRDNTETFVLYDYVGDISSLLDGTGGVPAFTDLGSGNSYGSKTIDTSASAPPTTAPIPEVIVDLNVIALTDINSILSGVNSDFVIGTMLSSISGTQGVEGLWTSSGLIPAVELTLTYASAVPVPPAIWLLGSGLLGLIGVARRKKT